MIVQPQNVEELIEKIGTQPLVIYGMGYVGGLIAEWCEWNQIDYVYVDRLAEEKKNNSERQVLLPEQLMQKYPFSVVVVASINYFDEIQVCLKEMGYKDDQILSCIRFWPKKISWEELEDTADWEKVRRRAQIFASWIVPTAKTVADYGYEKNFLKEFLSEGVCYEAPNYIQIQGDALIADFDRKGAMLPSDVSFGMAILMSFLNPEEVIEHLCSQTREAIIISYVPLERLRDISLRRSIDYHNDYTEEELITAFLKRGFVLRKQQQDPFDEVNMVYLFEKKS